MSCGRRAGRFAIEDDSRQIDVLSGHDFGKPLASRKAGTLDIEDGDDGVTFEARLPDDPPSWAIDAERAIAAGLMTGLSPGFSVPPASAVLDAERLEPEPGNPGVQIGVIRAAVLREFSIVTAPAYADAAVDLRAEDFGREPKRRRRVWLGIAAKTVADAYLGGGRRSRLIGSGAPRWRAFGDIVVTPSFLRGVSFSEFQLKSFILLASCGAEARIRTADLLITNQLLYH